MADDELQRLRRAAQRSGSTRFLLGLCDPDAGDLLRSIGRDGRRKLRDMLDYADCTAGERFVVVEVEVLSVHHRFTRVGVLSADSGDRDDLHFERWVRVDTEMKSADNKSYARFVEILRAQGADPARHDTWIGKEVVLAGGVYWPPNYLPPAFATIFGIRTNQRTAKVGPASLDGRSAGPTGGVASG